MCCLAWHTSGRQLAYTDTEGRLGLLDGLATSSTTDSAKVGTTSVSGGGNTEGLVHCGPIYTKKPTVFKKESV